MSAAAASHRAPAPVGPGAVVHVVATSGPPAPAALAAGVACLEHAGLAVAAPAAAGGPGAAVGGTPRATGTAHVDAAATAATVGADVAPTYLAAADAVRAAALARALTAPADEVLWAARGGYGAARLRAGLDPAALAARPRWLVGFSDVTALHAAWARAGLASLHAANVTTLPRWGAAARAELFAYLRQPTALSYGGHWLRGGGPIGGRLWGGNLTVLAALAGTGALPAAAGTVLFVEDVHEAPYRLDRAMDQLVAAGALAGVRAIVIGQLTDCPAPPGGTDAAAALVAAAAPLGVPIMAGVAVGHAPDSRILPLGLRADLVDADTPAGADGHAGARLQVAAPA